MGFFNMFEKKKPETSAKSEKTADQGGLDIYSGMRVEVLTDAGQMLFVAKLLGLCGNKGELHQYSEFAGNPDTQPLRANIRGYSDHEKKAVYMEGVITPGPKHIWHVEELTVTKIGNDRAFFRLEVNIDASITMFSGLEMGEKPCKLLNVSVGGAYIGSERRYHTGDKFLLTFRLLEDRPTSAMYCQVLRVIEREGGKYEYGCQFLELTEDDQETITKNIFAVQRQKKAEHKQRAYAPQGGRTL